MTLYPRRTGTTGRKIDIKTKIIIKETVFIPTYPNRI